MKYFILWMMLVVPDSRNIDRLEWHAFDTFKTLEECRLVRDDQERARKGRALVCLPEGTEPRARQL
jgi:hypothetical protein